MSVASQKHVLVCITEVSVGEREKNKPNRDSLMTFTAFLKLLLSSSLSVLFISLSQRSVPPLMFLFCF